MNFTKYVEQEKIKARIKNIEELRENIDTPEVKIKIRNHAILFGGLMTEKEIREGILSNLIIASKFCKAPSKQNISEKLAGEVLEIPKLSSAGKNCIRFNDEGDIVHSSLGNTKSADFYYQGYYATQKYTMSEGGAQDNQRNDVIDFLRRGSIKNKVMAIVDGDYWDKYRIALKEQFKDNENVIITSITELTGGETNE